MFGREKEKENREKEVPRNKKTMRRGQNNVLERISENKRKKEAENLST